MSADQQHAHRLLDQLAPGELEVVTRLLEVLLRSGAAGEAEDVSPETASELDHARAEIGRGEGIPHEDTLREFGLMPIVPLRPVKRKPGTGKGIWMSPDFDDPIEGFESGH